MEQEIEKNEMMIIHSMRLAGYLMLNGFHLVRNTPDRTNPRYDVYLFRSSDELLAAMGEYLKNRQKEQN